MTCLALNYCKHSCDLYAGYQLEDQQQMDLEADHEVWIFVLNTTYMCYNAVNYILACLQCVYVYTHVTG